MNILGINGSPNKNGNTYLLLKEVFKPIEKEGFDTNIFQIGGKQVHGCTACLICKEKKDGKCHIKNDAINICMEKMKVADAIIIGSPVYFSNVTTEVKALIDCAGYALRSANNILKHKVGAGVVVARRTGEIHTLNSINHFLFINQMILPGASYWNMAVGNKAGDVLNDDEGMKTMQNLGENIAWVLKKIGK